MRDYSNMDGQKMWRIKHGGKCEYHEYPHGQISPPVATTSASELSIIAGAVCLLITFAILAITILL